MVVSESRAKQQEASSRRADHIANSSNAKNDCRDVMAFHDLPPFSLPRFATLPKGSGLC